MLLGSTTTGRSAAAARPEGGAAQQAAEQATGVGRLEGGATQHAAEQTATVAGDARGRHASPDVVDGAARQRGFVGWYRGRPLIGGIITILAGLEMFASSQLDLGNIHIQVGIEGLQATILPILLVVLGMLAIFLPAQRIFYGILALVAALYSLVGVNLGGFFVGMPLGMVGGIMIVSWMPVSRRAQRSASAPAAAAAVRDDAVPDAAHHDTAHHDTARHDTAPDAAATDAANGIAANGIAQNGVE